MNALKFDRDHFHTNEYNKMLDFFENEINGDWEKVKSAQEANKEFFDKIKKITEDPNNAVNFVPLIFSLLLKTPRYSYMRIEYEGNRYEIRIDSLMYRLDITDQT